MVVSRTLRGRPIYLRRKFVVGFRHIQPELSDSCPFLYSPHSRIICKLGHIRLVMKITDADREKN
jgi:hypothetical protein